MADRGKDLAYFENLFVHSVNSMDSASHHLRAFIRSGTQVCPNSKQHSSSKYWTETRILCCVLKGKYTGWSLGIESTWSAGDVDCSLPKKINRLSDPMSIFKTRLTTNQHRWLELCSEPWLLLSPEDHRAVGYPSSPGRHIHPPHQMLALCHVLLRLQS